MKGRPQVQRRWTVYEQQWLVRHYGITHTRQECAEHLKRSYGSIKGRVEMLGLRQYGKDWRSAIDTGEAKAGPKEKEIKE